MNRIALLAATALTMFALSATALAHPATPLGRLVELAVIDRDSGAILPAHHSAGQSYVEGQPGRRYAVRLVNRTGARVLAVLSVDGINAVSGQTADPDQAGYVLGPYQSTDVTGWRKSLGEVAAFEFAALADSYAARTGRPDHVGVIGIAVFQERLPVPPPAIAMDGTRSKERLQPMERAGAAPAPAAPMAQSIGTAHGPREASQVSQTRFDRASRHPAEIVSLRYDRRENLVALGVIAPHPMRPRHPRPFPGGFVPDP
ncbi:hypothetical protein OS187_06140 [Xanthomonadaceae bacterium JHOS43]|nr:hypothetical protein [Xanthomonadaceae bacterium JHOS43]